MSQSRVRLLLAFAALPFVDALLGFFASPLIWYFVGHGGRPYDPDQTAMSFALVAGFLGATVTVVGAVPIVYWLMERGPLSLRRLIVAGAILGNGPFLFYVVRLVLPAALARWSDGTLSQHLMSLSDLAAGTFRVVTLGSVFGGVSAFVFWVLGIRQGHQASRILDC